MKTDVVLGLQWGDEGKGKIVDVLARRYPVVARFQQLCTEVRTLRNIQGRCNQYRRERRSPGPDNIPQRMRKYRKDRRPCKKQDSGGQESPSHTSDAPASGCCQ